MNPIEKVFTDLRENKRKAFIPFLTAGDPDIATTITLASALIDEGASLLEIGFPYSDPIADGPVIQASYTRALDKGLHIADVFTCAKQIRAKYPATPLVAMTSYSLVFRRGPEHFIAQAMEAGFSGAIVPDLPVEESDTLARLCAQHDFNLIQLVTPTTSPERAKRIVATSTGFLYCVSVTGITGERTTLPPELIDQLRWLREQTTLPLCVGFGISNPEHIHMLRDHVDGVIVGSAFVRQLEGASSAEECAGRLSALARSLVGALAGR